MLLYRILSINPYLPSPTMMRRLALFLLVLNAAAEAQYDYGPYGYGTTTKAVAPAATGTAAAAGAEESDGDNNPYEYGGIKISPKSAVVAHAACGALATMLILPAGVMAARAPRGFTGKRWWFPLHAGTQTVGLALVLAAFGIAWSLFTFHPVDTPHRKCATAFFALVLVQMLGGIFVHFIRPRLAIMRSTTRGIPNYVHMLLGLCTIGVGWATAWLGLTTEWQYRGHGKPAFGWRVGWGVVMGLWILLYAAGLLLLPRQLRREREERDTVTEGELAHRQPKETVGLTQRRES